MKLLLRLSLLAAFFITHDVSAQIYANERTPITPSILNLKGDYTFSYNGISHKLKVSDTSLIYIEYDSNGIELGNGTYYLNDDKFIFVPNQVSTESIIITPLQVRILEESFTEKKVIVQNIDSGTGVIINLIKL